MKTIDIEIAKRLERELHYLIEDLKMARKNAQAIATGVTTLLQNIGSIALLRDNRVAPINDLQRQLLESAGYDMFGDDKTKEPFTKCHYCRTGEGSSCDCI